ncbi:hypothetical protein B0H13DRAFT_1871914 [Mycena leptocephala]|nr:hypothetical protein B0H13DRAFT_1871914 [Mycena leptocephala]
MSVTCLGWLKPKFSPTITTYICATGDLVALNQLNGLSQFNPSTIQAVELNSYTDHKEMLIDAVEVKYVLHIIQFQKPMDMKAARLGKVADYTRAVSGGGDDDGKEKEP